MYKKFITHLFVLCILFSFSPGNIYAQNQGVVRAKVDARFDAGMEVTPAAARQLFTELPAQSLNHSINVKGTQVSVNSSGLVYILQEKPATLEINLPFEGKILPLKLIRSETPPSKIKAIGKSGTEEVEINGGAFYQGYIAGRKNSIGAISFFNDNIYGVISDDGIQNVSFSKISEGQYLIYSDKNIKRDNWNFCGTPDGDIELNKNELEIRANSHNCVPIVMVASYKLYLGMSSNSTQLTNFIRAIFNNMQTLYSNENIQIRLADIFIYTSDDPFDDTNSSTALGSFASNFSGNTGALYHLLDYSGNDNGGRAFVDVICDADDNYAYSDIDITYNEVLNYSWTIMVITHETGHNLGSRHTQWCGWPGGAIDNCWPTEGGCPLGPPPTNGGTMMSYCHLTSDGINFNNGFGPLPGGVIRDRVYNASCLSTCFEECDGLIVHAEADPNPVCSGKSVQFTATSGSLNGSFGWSGPNGFTNYDQNFTRNNVSESMEGVYTVTVTSTSGCTGTATVTLTVNPTPIATASYAPSPLCQGETIYLQASGGTNYHWTGPNSFTSNQQNPIIPNGQFSHQGLYYVTVTSAEGCTSTASVAVVMHSKVNATASATPNPVCSGSTLNLFASGGTTYNWSGPGGFTSILQNPTRNNMQVNQQGVYYVTVTSAAGCTGTAFVDVTVNPTPNANVNPSIQTLCSEKPIYPITVTSDVPGTVFNWTRDNTTNVTGIPGSGSGNTITGTLTNTTNVPQTVKFYITPEAGGCTGATIISTVIVNPKPVATATPASQAVCSGKPIQTIVLTSTVTGTTFSWTRDQPGITGIPMSGNGNISGTLTNSGTTTVTVTFTITPIANGCFGDPVTAQVIVYPLPRAAAFAEPNPVCEGALMWFRATGGVSYHWSGPNGFTWDDESFGRHMELNMAGVYRVTVTGSTGCTSTASVTATVLPGPSGATASVSPNPVCSGELVQFSASGGTRYEWKGPFGFTSTLQNPAIKNVQYYNEGTYTVEIFNGAGCSKTVTLELVVNQKPEGKISYDEKSTCEGSTLLLYASGGNAYQWSGPGGWSSTLQNPTRPNLNMSHSGTYSVTISNGACSVVLSVTVTVRAKPVIRAWTTTPSVCEGSTAYLFGDGATSYSWSGPYGYHSDFQNPIIEKIPVYMSGNYILTGTNEYGCTATATVNITVRDLNGQIGATPNPVPLGGTLYLTSGGGDTYQWTGPNGFHTNVQNPIITRFSKYNVGVYTVVISNREGCQDTKMVTVNLQSFRGNTNLIVNEVDGTYKQVYPNPASTVVKIAEDYTGEISYTIMNGAGVNVSAGKTFNGEDITIEGLASGIYFIQWKYVKDGQQVSHVSRFVKAN